jgi:protein TonB
MNAAKGETAEPRRLAGPPEAQKQKTDMLVSNILFIEPLGADRLPLTAAGAVRWPGAARRARPPVLAIGAAILLHAMAFGLTLAFVREPPAPSPPDEQPIELVFEPPEAPPSPAAEPAAPAEAPAPPDVPALPEAAALPPQSPQADAAPPEPSAPTIEQQPPEPPPPPRAEAKPKAPPAPPPMHRPAAKAVSSAEPARGAEPARMAAPPAAPHPAAPPAADPPIATDWQRSLAAWLASHKVYPELARRRGVEGSVGLRFTADRSGRVLNVSLLSSAGSPLLDAAAEKMVSDATLPPFPAGMPQQTATLTVTIRYALSN